MENRQECHLIELMVSLCQESWWVGGTRVLRFVVLSDTFSVLWLGTLTTLECGIYVLNLSFHLLQVGIHQVRVSKRPDVEQNFLKPSCKRRGRGGT